MVDLLNKTVVSNLLKTPLLRNVFLVCLCVFLIEFIHILFFHFSVFFLLTLVIYTLFMVLLILKLSRSYLDHTAKERELAEREQHYRTILDNIDVGYFETDLEGKLTFWNETVQRKTGATPEELKGLKTLNNMSEASNAEVSAAFNHLYRTGEPISNMEYEVISRTGQQWILEMSASLITDESGQPTGFRGTVLDITDRKNTEAELVKARDFLQHIMDSSIDSIVTTDLHGTITYGSNNLKTLLDYREEELQNKRVYHLYKNGVEDARRIMQELTEKSELKNYECQIIKKNGKVLDAMLSASLLKNGKGEVIGTLGIFKDITEKKKMEQRLLQGQILESIGTLAGGIAHEFNNALMGITGNIELMRMHVPEDDKILKLVQPIEIATMRMANLTSQLLAYARGGRYNPTTVSLCRFIENIMPILKQGMPPRINLETDFPENLPDVKADTTQLQMVLSAVVNNAMEAIEKEGVIKISVRTGEIDKDFISTDLDLKQGHYACIRIEDNGKGMDEETKRKVFDPFFTTKFQGRGLGMAAVYGIVINHDGLITIDSETNKGTVVRIYLPSSKADESGETVVEEVQYEMPEGPITILVIEDEEIVMDVNREMLKRLGYNILEAQTGDEAIRIVRDENNKIDIALLDIKLPDMTGGEVYQHIIKWHPELKVIVCSGYSIDGPAQELLNMGANGFIQKPFSLNNLSTKIREVLST